MSKPFKRHARKRKGKTSCGARLLHKQCDVCRRTKIFGQDESCCGQEIKFFCERPVDPGCRCEKHKGQPSVDELPKTVLGFDMDAFIGNAREVVAALRKDFNLAELTQAQIIWFAGKAQEQAMIGASQETQNATRHSLLHAARVFAEVQAATPTPTKGSEANEVFDLKAMSDDDLAAYLVLAQRYMKPSDNPVDRAPMPSEKTGEPPKRKISARDALDMALDPTLKLPGDNDDEKGGT